MLHPLSKLHAANGYNFVDDINQTPSGEQYFAIFKGATIGAVIASAEDWNGKALEAEEITFLNDEVPDGFYFMIRLQNVTLTSGKIALAIDQKK